MTLTRRSVLQGLLASSALSALTGAARADSTPFTRDGVIAMARDLARHSYQPMPEVPQDWRDLSYEQYKSIWFRHDRALWHGTDVPYDVDFFHPGLYFPRPVQISTVENGQATLVPFDLNNFDRTDQVPDLSTDGEMGFSGFRLRTELDQPGIRNEFAVFQGASYFRAIGIGEIYGLSARGLALHTADPKGEEFPDFTRFWLETPRPGQRNIVVHALLDSPSVTGAYRFDITPGTDCVMEVQATLFPRVDLTHVGLGPLTSMFMYDRTNRNRFDDFRPAVHDSDGLLIRNGAGEVIWRPLANPRHLQISAFGDENPRGFGLMQRARKLSDFDDLEALYHRRPGLWVEPHGDWGRGAVTLVEIPTDEEIYDNIVAYWRPAAPMPAGQQVDLAYRLTWGDQAPGQGALPRVIDTASGLSMSGNRVMVIEYEPHELLAGAPEDYTLRISSPHVETTTGVLQRNPETGGMRLVFGFDPGDHGLIELRAQLRCDGAPASEVWLYRWTA